jgi:thioredoxin reductase/NAD-dependent dihydropyrimidine dehydrogenase PreA subunit
MILLGVIAVAGIPYLLWSARDRRHRRRAARIADDVSALGDDAVPGSLHPEIALDQCIGSGACVRACPEHDVIGLVDGRAHLINPLACVGHGACAAACPVGAIQLVFGTAHRGIELPLVSEDFETSQPGVYVIGELGGMGLIRNAVSQGRQAAEALIRSGRRGKGDVLDAVVVGAGPAGISAALTLIAHDRRVLLLEQAEFGGTIRHYPRKKVVMTGSFELAGYGTIRRRTMSKEELIALWEDIRARTDLPVQEGTRVDLLAAEDGHWRVCAGDWSVPAAGVLLALGRRGAPRQLGVPGEELDKVSYRVLEPTEFADKHVLVVGGGNAAADCALALADDGGCKSVGLSYRRHELARMRSSVRARVEQAMTAGAIHPHLGTEVVEIRPETVVLKGGGKTTKVRNDAVVVQIGGTPPSELIKTIGIEIVEKRGER